MDELILHSERHNFRGSFDTDDWGALASHTLRQVLLKTWIMARYRGRCHCRTAHHTFSPKKTPHPHCKLSQEIYSHLTSPAICVRGQGPSYKQAEPSVSSATNRMETGLNKQCHERWEKVLTMNPASSTSPGLQVNTGEETHTRTS